MKSNKGCPNIESKKSSALFFNQRFLQQSSLMGIDSVKKFAPKEWLNHSNEIDHPFQNELMKAKNEAIQQVLDYHNHEYKNNELIKIGIEMGLISDDDNSKSVYSDATDPYYFQTEAKLVKVLNKILGIRTIWDFTLQLSWSKRDHKDEEYKMFCPCGRSHIEWLEQEGFVEFMQKDIKMRQLCRIS